MDLPPVPSPLVKSPPEGGLLVVVRSMGGENWYTLDHELLDHSVEARALVTKALLASCEGAEVLCGLFRVSSAAALEQFKN